MAAFEVAADLNSVLDFTSTVLDDKHLDAAAQHLERVIAITGVTLFQKMIETAAASATESAANAVKQATQSAVRQATTTGKTSGKAPQTTTQTAPRLTAVQQDSPNYRVSKLIH